MKKEYIKPEMQVHEIEAQQLLAGQQDVEFYKDKIPDDENEDMW